MKNIPIAVRLFATVFGRSSFAQTDSSSVLKNFLASYLNLKNALTIDDGDSARIAARQLFDAVDEMTADSFSSSQQAVWSQFHKKLRGEAVQIRNADDIEGQREHFKNLSADMYQFLKAVGITSVELYYDYCPMAKAYWLSETPSISNPYLGQMMPTCGSVKDTLTVNK